jgi:predicted molibdopterin-dependent oxidoreductase YjgC
MTRRIDRLNREAPTGYMKIHPEDAARLGIGEGDTVNVRSRRGKISIQAEPSTEVEPGLVFIPMHFAECPVNTLTNAVFDPVAKIPGFKVCAVAIEH